MVLVVSGFVAAVFDAVPGILFIEIFRLRVFGSRYISSLINPGEETTIVPVFRVNGKE